MIDLLIMLVPFAAGLVVFSALRSARKARERERAAMLDVEEQCFWAAKQDEAYRDAHNEAMNETRERLAKKYAERVPENGRQDFLDEEREARELRLERRPVKWLGARHKKWRKGQAPLPSDPAARIEEARRRLEAGETEPEDPTPEDIKRHQVEIAERSVKKDRADSKPNDAIAPMFDGVPEEMIKREEPKDLAHLTPVERGGFSPTEEEYHATVVPAYLQSNEGTTPEELARWEALTDAKQRYRDAVKTRSARGGVSSCATAPVFVKGHQWWKVPGQPRWECMECGQATGTMYADLIDGCLRRITGGITRDARSALAKLGSGDVEFLGQAMLSNESESTLRELKKASGQLVLSGKMNEHPSELSDLAVMGVEQDAKIRLSDVQDTRPFLFKLNEETLDLCMNCGCGKGAHRIEKQAKVDGVRVPALRWCPHLDRDGC